MKTNKLINPAWPRLIVNLIVLAVVLNGLLLIAGTLVGQFSLHSGRIHLSFTDDAFFGVRLIIGLTMLYLSTLLARRKRMAWLLSVVAYSLVIALAIAAMLNLPLRHQLIGGPLPLIILLGLILARKEFTVKSDIQSFRQALGFIVVVLAVTFIYGTVGFMLMDVHDFHHEIGLIEAMHRTIDQFGLTTSHALVPYTRRARIFLDSLTVISWGALAYAVFSLFQPLKARFSDQNQAREHVRSLLAHYPASSEDFFKLWPSDKLYFFSQQGNAGLALKVHRGMALVAGDPAGRREEFAEMLSDFISMCHVNDWQPSFIHTEPKYNELYRANGFMIQKIGEEAILNLSDFQENVRSNKYFRHIANKFAKQNYTTEMLSPPHDQALIKRLRTISDDWLSLPGRVERGFMMGYFDREYLHSCNIMVARDGAGTIQAFMNQIPSFEDSVANFDLMRHTKDSPGNINDYLLMNFIDYLFSNGLERLNLGLCPLVGLDKDDDKRGLIDNALKFLYANTDRFYSFSGLHRFKAKYEPEWSDRYLAYKGGIRGFARVTNALTRAMRVKNAK